MLELVPGFVPFLTALLLKCQDSKGYYVNTPLCVNIRQPLRACESSPLSDMIHVMYLVSITLRLWCRCLSAFICQPTFRRVSQSVSQMSQSVSRHGSTHKCLFVPFSSLQTQALHHPVNSFVRWPLHRASQEDRQLFYQPVCEAVFVLVYMFQLQGSSLRSGNKRPPRYLL